MSFNRKQAEIYREDIIIEEEIWGVFKKYPKITVARAIYILAEMIAHLAHKQK
jgi:hypothetical protein